MAAPDSKIFLRIPASATDAATANTNRIETLLPNGLSTFFNKWKPVFDNGPNSLHAELTI